MIKVVDTIVRKNVNVCVPVLVEMCLSLAQLNELVKGAEKGFSADKHSPEEAAAYCKLMHYAFNTATAASHELTIECKTTHLEYWKQFIKVRMAYMEEQRDIEKGGEVPSEEFDKDLYIICKELWFDMREATMISIDTSEEMASAINPNG